MSRRDKLLKIVEPYEEDTLYTCVILGGVISHLYDHSIKEEDYNISEMIKELEKITEDDFDDRSESSDERLGFDITKKMKKSYLNLIEALIQKLKRTETTCWDCEHMQVGDNIDNETQSENGTKFFCMKHRTWYDKITEDDSEDCIDFDREVD